MVVYFEIQIAPMFFFAQAKLGLDFGKPTKSWLQWILPTPMGESWKKCPFFAWEIPSGIN